MLDSLAFALILLVASKSKAGKVKIPILLKTILGDAMVYYLFIFSSHLVLTLTLLFARVSTTAPLSVSQLMCMSLAIDPASSSSVSFY